MLDNKQQKLALKYARLYIKQSIIDLEAAMVGHGPKSSYRLILEKQIKALKTDEKQLLN